MTHGRLAQGILALFFSVSGLSAAGTLSGCSDDTPPTPEESHCTNRCNCEQCTTAEKGTCIDDLTNLKSDAADKNCSTEFKAFLSCLNVSSTCSDTIYDSSFCYAEETVLNDCINPKPACATTNNGTCDEPEGTNTCAEGSDVMDCAQPCPYVEDGFCNEPAPAGDGLCAPGTDAIDCGAMPCAYTNNGICNEPAPAGDGLCAAGTDTTDCGGMCYTCADALNDSSLMLSDLCSASQTLLNNFINCVCVSSCSAQCYTGTDFCDGYAASTACQTCITSSCSSQLNACANDL